jgi:hypothetical protein
MAIGVRGYRTVHRHRTSTLNLEHGTDSTRHVQPTATRSRHASSTRWTLHVRTLAENPDWCSDVPASPSPPNFDYQRGEWAAGRYMCMHKRPDLSCGELCLDAEERWRQKKAGLLDRASTFPSPTDKPQGPFPGPGGAKGYILPMQPAPKVPTPNPG